MKYSVFAFLLALQGLFAEIVEIKYISDLDKFIADGTFVIFDIDNTIMEPVQEVGSDSWFEYRIQFHKKKGLSAEDAFETALSEWMAVQHITDVKLVEPHTASLIRELQSQGKLICGLTSRDLGLAGRTIRQLATLNIQLDKTSPSKEEFLFQNGRNCLYRLGILFTSGSDKAAALQRFFDLTHWKPHNIVYIDDKVEHLKVIEKLCKSLKIPFFGLRYGFLDEKSAQFRSGIADLQFEKFRSILSNQDAEKLLSPLVENKEQPSSSRLE